MTRDRRFKHRVRRRMRETGQNYAAALAAERATRPLARRVSSDRHSERKTRAPMNMKPAVATRLRGIWLGISDAGRSREFYERIGAHFDDVGSDGIIYGTVGGIRLIFEVARVDPAVPVLAHTWCSMSPTRTPYTPNWRAPAALSRRHPRTNRGGGSSTSLIPTATPSPSLARSAEESSCAWHRARLDGSGRRACSFRVVPLRGCVDERVGRGPANGESGKLASAPRG